MIARWAAPGGANEGRGFAFAAPMKPGATEDARKFAREAYETRRKEMDESRLAQGLTREEVYLNQTPGDVIVVYLEGEDPNEGNRRFAVSQTPYDRWFKDRCKEIFPAYVNFDQPVPANEEVFAWVESKTVVPAHKTDHDGPLQRPGGGPRRGAGQQWRVGGGEAASAGRARAHGLRYRHRVAVTNNEQGPRSARPLLQVRSCRAASGAMFRPRGRGWARQPVLLELLFGERKQHRLPSDGRFDAVGWQPEILLDQPVPTLKYRPWISFTVPIFCSSSV